MPEYRLQKYRGKWAISVSDKGKRISRHSLATANRVEAERHLKEFTAKAEQIADPKIEQIVDLYIKDKQGRPSIETLKYTWKALAPHFEGLKPYEINVDLCRNYAKNRIQTGIKQGTVHSELSRLRTALNWAQKHKVITKAPYIEVPSKPAPRDRRFTHDQVSKLLEGCKTPHIYLFVMLAVSTAGRSAALLDLTWNRVDFDRKLIKLSPDIGGNRKNRATVPMTQSLETALREAKRAALTDYVIEWAGQRVGSVKKALERAGHSAGLGKVSPHDLRHSAACIMAEGGVPMSEIASYLGHSDSRITEKVYAKYSPEYLRKAANALEF